MIQFDFTIALIITTHFVLNISQLTTLIYKRLQINIIIINQSYHSVSQNILFNKQSLMNEASQSRLNRQVSSTLQIHRRIQKKITQHVKEIIRQNNSAQNQKTTPKPQLIPQKPQLIPQKIIQKNKLTHKYLYKKTLINTKFQWLNKYLESSQLQSLSVKLKPSKAELLNKQNHHLKPQENVFPDWKRNKRSKTQGPYFQGDIQHVTPQQLSDNHNRAFFSEHHNPDNDPIFKQRSMNKKIGSQNHFRLKKSKSVRQKRNLSGLDDQHLRKMLIDEKKINRSNCKYLQEVNYNLNKVYDKQNQPNHTFEGRRQMGFRIKIDQNTPVKQFLECSARINKSNLMMKNKSGQIKDRKRQYIFQSRQEKRQQSELLRIKKRCEQEITVEPWNLGGNQKQENQENDFIMNKHQ